MHQLKSECVGDEFEVSVGTCTLKDERPNEVLLVTDPVILFGATMDIGHGLLLTKRLPSMFVVGVGYPKAANLLETLGVRARDLTPTAVEPEYPGSGHASAFVEFIRSELSPWLELHYGIGAQGAAYFGHSFGGLFGAWVLLHEPGTFRRYGLSSPSLWWDKGTLFTDEAAYARAHDDLAARVFVSVGELERPSGGLARISQLPEEDREKERREIATDSVDMVAGAELLVDALRGRAYPNLDIELQVQPQESHETVPLVSISRSLRYLYDVIV